jgi:hypothetical protein
MIANLGKLKEKRQLESIILVCVLVATNMIVIFPLIAPKAEGVTHLASAAAEDAAGAPYDLDGIPGNGHVLWANDEDHIINTDYTVEAGMTLEIPNLNYRSGVSDPNVIEFMPGHLGGKRIDVDGTLITHPSPGFPAFTQWTCFTTGGLTGWEGIYFHNGSKGVIRHLLINNSQNGIVMEPGSSLLSPGIDGSRFEYIKNFGMQMDGVSGATNIANTDFYRKRGLPKTETGIGLVVANGELNLTSRVRFNSHGPGLSSLHIVNATVNADGASFEGYNQTGYSVFVEGSGSDNTVLDNCDFQKGVADNHYIRSDGASFLINNNTFDTRDGQLTVIANDYGAVLANPILRNPNCVTPGTTFDNTTMNVTGGSSITLQWFHDVYVEDPNSNLISNAPVWIADRLGNPAQPSSKITDLTGWAKWFICSELIQYSGSTTHLNPFNVSAENNSMIGYAAGHINLSSNNTTVIVPFNPIPTIPPIVSYLNIVPVPGGVQTGLVTIEFMLEDPDVADDGNLSVLVEFWDPLSGIGWVSATLHPSSDPTTNLNNNTLYTLIWDSKAMGNFPLSYSSDMKIKITPFDKGGGGTPSESATFILDNEPPQLLSGPFVTVINDIAFQYMNLRMQMFGMALLPTFQTQNRATQVQLRNLLYLQTYSQVEIIHMSLNPLIRSGTSFHPSLILLKRKFVSSCIKDGT